jgi:hypothetical protein
MSNLLDQNPLIFDAASTTAVVITDRVKITKIRWSEPTTVDHTAILKDKNGKELWKGSLLDIGTATNTLVLIPDSDFNPPMIADGLIMHTLGSGRLFVHYDGAPPLKT